MIDKSELKVSCDIPNFATTGFFACNAKCKTECGRKRPDTEHPEFIQDLSIYCANFTENTEQESE